MSAISSFLLAVGVMLGALCELACYAFRSGWAMMLSKARLAARVLAAESQLAIKLKRTGGRRRRRQFTPAFRLLWVALSKLLDGWEELAHLMKPETVTRWHRRAFRLFWRWRMRCSSSSAVSAGGMPFGEQPCYLFPDNDGIYGHGVHAVLIPCGILEVRIAHQSPWQNPYIERFIGSLRRELLHYVIALSQAHRERLLREFIDDYYHRARPHQGLSGDTPLPHALSGQGELISVPVLGGLHHRYYRAAA